MRVDAHQHFWDPSRADYPWMTDELAPIHRVFGPTDLAPLLEAAGIERTILVQTRSSLDETVEALATAETTEFVGGVVGWADLTDPDLAATIERLRAGPGGSRLVGLRHQVHDEADPNWLLRPDVQLGIAATGAAGLAFDLLVRNREMPAALATVRAAPDVQFVIDHLAKPPIRRSAFQPWAELIRPFGELPNVWCKVSGLVTEAYWAMWRTDDFKPYVEHALDVFGARRLVFGSDWPVCLLAASYEQVMETARSALGQLTETEEAAIFGGNAAAVYRLGAS